MDQRNSTFKEIWKVVVGEIVVCAIMALVFLIFDALTINVLYGALLGIATNLLSFLALCITIEKIISDSDKDKGLKVQKLSYILRLGIMAVGLAIGLKFDIFNNIAVIVPLLVTRPALSIFALFEKKEVDKDNAD